MWERLRFGVANGAPAVRSDRMGPDKAAEHAGLLGADFQTFPSSLRNGKVRRIGVDPV
jgi:hypothetical protein